MAAFLFCLIAWLAPIAELLGLTNNWRAQHDQTELVIESESQAAAMAWTSTMIDTGRFEHAEDLSIGIEPGWLMLGENLGRATQQPDQIGLLFEAVTRSPAHNENLLEPGWTGIGLGVSTDLDGTTWVTMRFVARAHLSAAALGVHSRQRE